MNDNAPLCPHGYLKNLCGLCEPVTAPAKPPAEESPSEYARVEILGYRTHVGRISEVEKFGTKLLRVDVPKGKFENGFTTYFYGGGSIYGITPCDLAFVERANRDQTPPALLTVQPDAISRQEDEDNGVETDEPLEGDAEFEDER